MAPIEVDMIYLQLSRLNNRIQKSSKSISNFNKVMVVIMHQRKVNSFVTTATLLRGVSNVNAAAAAAAARKKNAL